jgi:hypothetical protein
MFSGWLDRHGSRVYLDYWFIVRTPFTKMYILYIFVHLQYFTAPSFLCTYRNCLVSYNSNVYKGRDDSTSNTAKNEKSKSKLVATESFGHLS